MLFMIDLISRVLSEEKKKLTSEAKDLHKANYKYLALFSYQLRIDLNQPQLSQPSSHVCVFRFTRWMHMNTNSVVNSSGIFFVGRGRATRALGRSLGQNLTKFWTEHHSGFLFSSCTCMSQRINCILCWLYEGHIKTVLDTQHAFNVH